mmetsp:Transcript_22231/g.44115  ORF Transcript_22231/g.44115 Transcript_22231/m.44115 type:complete len:221 (+) Transcript_22231:184-846(+)
MKYSAAIFKIIVGETFKRRSTLLMKKPRSNLGRLLFFGSTVAYLLSRARRGRCRERRRQLCISGGCSSAGWGRRFCRLYWSLIFFLCTLDLCVGGCSRAFWPCSAHLFGQLRKLIFGTFRVQLSNHDMSIIPKFSDCFGAGAAGGHYVSAQRQAAVVCRMHEASSSKEGHQISVLDIDLEAAHSAFLQTPKVLRSLLSFWREVILVWHKIHDESSFPSTA